MATAKEIWEEFKKTGKVPAGTSSTESGAQPEEKSSGKSAKEIWEEFKKTGKVPGAEQTPVTQQNVSGEDKSETPAADNWLMENQKKYDALRENEDFGELSKIRGQAEPQSMAEILFGGDANYNYIAGIEEKIRNGTYEPPQEGFQDTHGLYGYMTPEELDIYFYLHNKEGKKSANAYLKYLNYTLSARAKKQDTDTAAWLATSSPFVADFVSVGQNLTSGAGYLENALEAAIGKISEAVTGEYAGPVDYNTGTTASTVATTIRQTRASNLANKYGAIELDPEEHPILSRLLNGKSLGDVYQLGMSMMDSGAVALLSPVLGGFGIVLLGGSAATQAMLDAAEKGATDGQALTMGLLSGAFEMIFEKFSLDKLLKGDTKNIVKAAFQQGITEGFEELFTSLANMVADLLVMAEKSNLRTAVADYREQGLNRGDAWKQALIDEAISIGWDFIGGFASGNIMGGGKAAIGNVTNQGQGNAQPNRGNSQEGAGQRQTGQSTREDTSRQQPQTPVIGTENRQETQPHPQNQPVTGGADLSGDSPLEIANRLWDRGMLSWKDLISVTQTARGDDANFTQSAAALRAILESKGYGDTEIDRLFQGRWAAQDDTGEQVRESEPDKEGTSSEDNLTAAELRAMSPEAVARRLMEKGDITYEQYLGALGILDWDGSYQTEFTKTLAALVKDDRLNENDIARHLRWEREWNQITSAESETTGNVHENAPAAREESDDVPPIQWYGAESQAAGNVQENVPAAQETDADTAEQVSVAEQIRREQNENGGMTYEETDGGLRPGAAWEQPGTGNGVPDGIQGRYAGTGAREQAGSLGTGAANRGGKRNAYQGRTVADRQNGARSLPYVSSRDLGLQTGTENRNIKVIPREMWDEQLQRTAAQIMEDTGKEVTFVIGAIQVRGSDGKLRNVRGVYTEDSIIIQADHSRVDPEKLADHEIYHYKSDSLPGLHNRIREHIVQTYSEEEYRKILEVYVRNMRGVYNVADAVTGEDYDALVRNIEEEIFADAYAGINAFGAHAENWTEAVHQKMNELGPNVGKAKLQENGVRVTNGPPGERYSIDNISGELAEYGDGVILDTNLFDGVMPRDWGKVLSKFVYENLAGTGLTVYDKNGQPEFIEFARTNDRAWKDGAKNSHKVIDKLARYRGDNARALATIHLSELLITSRYENATNEHSHQWLDENGWEYRKTHIEDRSGNIYEATLNIAVGRERRILYDVNNVRMIDKKRVARGVVPSTNSGRGSLTKSNSTVGSIADKTRKVKERFSVDDVDSDGNELSAEQQEYFEDSKVRDDQGRLIPMYHGTDSPDFTVFDPKYSDDEISLFFTSDPDVADTYTQLNGRDVDPYNLITKDSSAEQFNNAQERVGGGLRVVKITPEWIQKMKGVAEKKTTSLLSIANRYADLLEANNDFGLFDTEIERIREIAGKGDKILRPKDILAIKNAMLSAKRHTFMLGNSAASEEINRMNSDNYKLFTELSAYATAAFTKGDALGQYIYTEANSANPFLLGGRLNDFSGMLEYGTEQDMVAKAFSRSKWAKETNMGNRYKVYLNITNPMIVDAQGKNWNELPEGKTRDYARKAKVKGNDGVIFKNIIDNGGSGRAGASTVAVAFNSEQVKSVDNRKPTSNPDIRYSVDDSDAQQEEKPKRKAVQPVAESKPIIAKRDLKNTLNNLFSIPAGQKAVLGTVIDSFADRIIKNGSLTEDDRSAFFDRMYESGVMTIPADDYYQQGRNLVAGGKVYADANLRADFGDDWESFRRRAFAAGVYLTNNREDGGVDMWNHELSGILPGLFDSEETDNRMIVERIVQIAEEGRDEKVSLAEYTARLAEMEHIPEDEFLDNMERQMDWALRTFAEKAELELKLRDRTGKKITEERERSRERLTRERLKETQRRAEERAERKEKAQRQRERKELRELQQKTLKQLQWLSRNRNRAPEELRSTWDEVLGDLDIYAVSAANEMNWSDKYNATWKDLTQMYKTAMETDPNFLPSKELERIMARVDGAKIEDMDPGALQDLYKAAIGLRTEFYNRNNVINDEMNRLFAEVYTDSKKEIETAPGGYTGNRADKFMNLEQLTPMNVLQRMGGWDPDGAFYSMAKQLEKGERDQRAFAVKANRMLKDFLTEHKDWVKKADGQGKDGIWHEVEIPTLLALEVGKPPVFGETVKVWMTPAQKVHMYLESKNQDNLRHMTGGRTFVNKELYSQGKRQEALAQGTTIHIAPQTVKAIVADMTAEETELARLLDTYYNTFSTQEINRVSNILYGYDKAMGNSYAPIYTNRNYTKMEFGVFDTTAEGVGNLKGRQYAVNPSYNISAFDAFERHRDMTARFVGFAIPTRNWTTLMNWREKNNSTGDVITHKWGEESKNYITDLLNTLQGGDSSKTESVSEGVNKLMSNYITAVFGANPSIVLKQLGSIPMASAYLGVENTPSLAQIRNIDRELIAKYTQDLDWRTMGYSMPETKQLKDNPNWTQSNKFFGFVFGGDAITAMDGWAASTLWPWAENKVRREHRELEQGSDEFYKLVAEEFENAVSRSQSTSDETHQSQIRKSKNVVTKAFTMFRSDSAQTYNTIRQKIGELQYYTRKGESEATIKSAKKAVGSAFGALLLNAAWAEGVSFLMALWKNKGKKYRDEEDELTAGSVAGEMVSNIFTSMLGTVTFGEEIAEAIGAVVQGEKWYDIEAPGLEQLNEAINAIIDAGGGMTEFFKGAANVVKNGGDLGRYFGDHDGELLGHIKNLAETAATYLTGLSVTNVEAYLMGAVKWVSPKLGLAYDDLFQEIGKGDLSGLEGDALESRIGRILGDRRVSDADETAQVLAELYAAGYKAAVPGEIPSSVTIDGEKQELNVYQQQAYDTIWGSIVKDALDDLVASDGFADSDLETREKMLDRLYDYAGEMARAELFDWYEISSSAEKFQSALAEGLTVDQYLTMVVSGAKTSDFQEMTDRGMDPDDAYRLSMELSQLRPEAGEDRVQDVQRWRECVEFSTVAAIQINALYSQMTEAQFKKLETAYTFDIDPDVFVGYYEIREQFDANTNGSYSNAEIQAAIDSMGKYRLTTEQKAALWQLMTGSKSAKNNPYSTEEGQRLLNYLSEE